MRVVVRTLGKQRLLASGAKSLKFRTNMLPIRIVMRGHAGVCAVTRRMRPFMQSSEVQGLFQL